MVTSASFLLGWGVLIGYIVFVVVKRAASNRSEVTPQAPSPGEFPDQSADLEERIACLEARVAELEGDLAQARRANGSAGGVIAALHQVGWWPGSR
ncbi:MAG: hypothetical protein LBG11_04990 [Bifidobacteriaceae bacterium]|jgi:hypothetical protein|nr:hypothetical protein [Bifidobacteriaceae bacterium]